MNDALKSFLIMNLFIFMHQVFNLYEIEKKKYNYKTSNITIDFIKQ